MKKEDLRWKKKIETDDVIRSIVRSEKIENTVLGGASPYLLDDIRTEIGNEIITWLQTEKWQVVLQYSVLAFDKGIDFDYFLLKKSDEFLYFEWDNWFKWKIIGYQQVVSQLLIVIRWFVAKRK